MRKGMTIIRCEMAKTPSAHQRGLMFRENLEEDSGMLFHFGKSQPLSFWGMNTFIPLDIAFINADGIIENVDVIKPHCLHSVKSSRPCLYALEVPEGTLKRHGIGAGDFAEVMEKGLGSEVFLIKKMGMGPMKVSMEDMEHNGKYAADSETVPARSSAMSAPSDISVPKFSSVFDALSWCIKNNQVCRISYRTDNGRVIARDVEPHDIFYCSKKHHQVLSAWDENASNPRSYVVMRIISYAIPGRKFVPKIQLH